MGEVSEKNMNIKKSETNQVKDFFDSPINIILTIWFTFICIVFAVLILKTIYDDKVEELLFPFVSSIFCVVLNILYIIHLIFTCKIKAITLISTILCFACIGVTYAIQLFEWSSLHIPIILSISLLIFLGALAIVVTRDVRINNRMAYLMNCVATVLFLDSAIIYGLQGSYGTLFTRGQEETILSVNQIFYFVSVTFSTVGYGDIIPIPEKLPAMAASIIMSLTNIYMLIIVFGGLSFITRKK